MSRNETILVVERDLLFENEKTQFQGSLFDEDEVTNHLNIISENYKSMRRGNVDEGDKPINDCAERNEGFKQPIPYIVITKGDKFYVTERLEGGGESRLHGKLSMGIGGHMNPIEGFDSFDGLLKENTLRELNEELVVEDNNENLDIIMGGLINDDENEVGKVHIGLLGKIQLSETQNVSIREVEQLKGTWYTSDELLSPEIFPRVESWGKIVLQAIKSGEFKV